MKASLSFSSLAVTFAASLPKAAVFSASCPGPRPPLWAVKRPALLFCDTIYYFAKNELPWETLRALNRPGRARTVSRDATSPSDFRRVLTSSLPPSAAARACSHCPRPRLIQ
jgi:hypothetical protein